MTFDQYQRYAVAAAAIRRIAAADERPRVLEIGAGRERVLAALMPGADLHYLDVDPEATAGGAENFLIADARQAPYEDASFDVVLALDVFEHVPAADRAAFLAQLHRLARKLVVLCAPFDTPVTREVEEQARRSWAALTAEPHRWLEEHRQIGLPDLAATKAQLAGLPLPGCWLAHGAASRWLGLMRAHFAEVRVAPMRPLVTALHAAYPQHGFAADFHADRPYRHFFFGSRDDAIRTSIETWLAGLGSKAADPPWMRTLVDAIPAIAEEHQALVQQRDVARSEALRAKEDARQASQHLQQLQQDLLQAGQEVQQARQDLEAQGLVRDKTQQQQVEMHVALIERSAAHDDLRATFPGRLGKAWLDLRKRLLNGVRELFPLRYRPRLAPASQLDAQGDGKRFTSTGNDPYFLLFARRGYPLPSGVVRIRFRGSAGLRPLTPVLYVDDGAGFREGLTYVLHANADGACDGYFALPRQVRGLRLDPCREPGQFRIDHLEIIGGGKLWVLMQSLRLGEDFAPAGRRPGLSRYLELVHSDARKNARARLLRSNQNRMHANEALYGKWLSTYEVLDDAQREAMRAELSAEPARPLVSVLMPVYDPPPALLDAAIRSVRGQLYDRWELCIADDASPNPEIAALLRRHMAEDSRIRVVFRERNGHISEASNSALAIATGEWVALLDHDDLLAETALYWMTRAARQRPDAQMLYSDEDKIDLRGQRSDPHFKSDFNYELLLSYNFCCHLSLFRRELLSTLGGFRTGVEGAQDYDLVLRTYEQVGAGAIVHVPRVLYHWRVHAGSTALAGREKSYALLAGERALRQHLSRRGVRATVSGDEAGGHYRVRYALPTPPPLVSLIIPTRNAAGLVRQCIESIRKLTRYPHYEILLVDNGSDEAESLRYFESLATSDGVRVLRDERPFNFSALNNAAVAEARGSVLALVNNDIEVISPDWLEEMTAIACQPGIGAVGARLWYPDAGLQHGGVVIGIGGVAGHAHLGLSRRDAGYMSRARITQSFSAVTAACLVVQKQHYLAVGGLNETDLAVAFNDIDFCLKLREAGLRNVWTPHAELFHHESATRGHENTPEKQMRFNREVAYMMQRWQSVIGRDPAYNPNLDLSDCASCFALAWPPRDMAPA